MRLKKTRKGSTTRQVRQQLQQLLQRRDHEALRRWATAEPKALRIVFAALQEVDELQRWRAIEALGILAAQAAEQDEETIRDWIRRLFWNMMEESGGLMWHGPEAIGEILANVPWLIREFVKPLGSFRVEEPFEAGTYTALARLAAIEPDPVAEIAPFLVPGLTDGDPRIRAHAALALGRVGYAPARTDIDALSQDPASITVYDTATGLLQHTTVGEQVRAVQLHEE